jgi:hypothetical protein
MLHRQVFPPGSTRLALTALDANILLSSYFPSQYDVTNLNSTDGLKLLQRAQAFVTAVPSSLQLSSECNERWLHLLVCMFLPFHVSVMSNEMKVQALVSLRPPSLTNDTLRQTYLSLLRQSTLGKLVTEKPVDFVDFDNVVKFNKNRQNDDNVVKAYKS